MIKTHPGGQSEGASFKPGGVADEAMILRNRVEQQSDLIMMLKNRNDDLQVSVPCTVDSTFSPVALDFQNSAFYSLSSFASFSQSWFAGCCLVLVPMSPTQEELVSTRDQLAISGKEVAKVTAAKNAATQRLDLINSRQVTSWLS
jgi:hypothetical protein